MPHRCTPRPALRSRPPGSMAGRPSGPRRWALLGVNVGLSAARGQVELLALGVPLVIALGAALQAALGCALVRRFVAQPLTLAQPRDIWRFLLLAAPVACLVNATLATAALGLAGAVPAVGAGVHLVGLVDRRCAGRADRRAGRAGADRPAAQRLGTTARYGGLAAAAGDSAAGRGHAWRWRAGTSSACAAPSSARPLRPATPWLPG